MLATLISASTLRATAANLRAMASTLPGASSLLLMTTVLDLHSLELTWKWRMAPWKTIFHYKQVVFHFHVSFRECKPSNFFQLPETPILLKFQQFGQIEIYKHFACTHVYKTYRRYIYILYIYLSLEVCGCGLFLGGLVCHDKHEDRCADAGILRPGCSVPPGNKLR